LRKISWNVFVAPSLAGTAVIGATWNSNRPKFIGFPVVLHIGDGPAAAKVNTNEKVLMLVLIHSQISYRKEHSPALEIFHHNIYSAGI
jgi:hypothetical protein